MRNINIQGLTIRKFIDIITRDSFVGYTYIILGRCGPTGKTTLKTCFLKKV